MVKETLLAWVGKTDIRAARNELSGALGPIAQAVHVGGFDEIHLLSDHEPKTTHEYVKWLISTSNVKTVAHPVRLSGPTNHAEIYEAAVKVLENLRSDPKGLRRFTYHLSPGTPAMASVWVLLSQTTYPAALLESSPEEGVRDVHLPFEIAADFLPHLRGRQVDEIARLTEGLPPEAPGFETIIHRCAPMKRVVAQARRLAVYPVSVLILGESGTGKELFARAIHRTGDRSGGPFVPVNCGAIPSELMEAEFFGHAKGGFTGADEDRAGYFEAASGGTLFLDEVGELPLSAQVKLLRALQDRKIQRVRGKKQIDVDIRVIAATNRDLAADVANGKFREDLFHRLAVGVLKLPPLRERHGDLNPLIDAILQNVNAECSRSRGWKQKILSAGGRNLLHRHHWPGNIRELFNTLSRAAIWTPEESIDATAVREAMFPLGVADAARPDILNRPLGNDLRLPDIIKDVARHYLQRAMKEASGNKTEAAKLIGLASYQTLTNWLKKYDIDE